MKSLQAYRQIHLDFHYSPHIEGIAKGFNAESFAKTLVDANVEAITLFASCHHGWSYYDTKIGKRHPHLEFDLLRAQYLACLSVRVKVQIYLTAGVNNEEWESHPEWREIRADGTYPRIKDVFSPGFKKLCLNSGYVDLLCEQIAEVATLFPKAEGVFLDIINQGSCCCETCLSEMKKLRIDASDDAQRKDFSRHALTQYYKKTFKALRKINPKMGIFHNSGHLKRGNRNDLKYFTHLELESLPTGGWGYDHFPMSACYARNLDMSFSGMTGKFHTTWGEMGGFKHPNALLYECASMLAFGARCCIGDHPQPDANLDKSTYDTIGQVYHDVKKKEEWCKNSKHIADIAVLSIEAFCPQVSGRENAADTGATRVLLEEHFLFDIIDQGIDFTKYKMLILPDNIIIDDLLKSKLDQYINQGGKLLLTGNSGIDSDGKFIFDVGAVCRGKSDFELDYILPNPDLRADFVSAPTVMYKPAQRVEVTDGKSMGDIYVPWFNRTWEHFSGHQHSPAKSEASGYACGVRKNSIIYLAHPVFSIYYQIGAVACRQYIAKALRSLLNVDESVRSNLPSTARLTLTEQMQEKRYVLHVLYANTIKRGADMRLAGGTVTQNTEIEIIEELNPLINIEIHLTLPRCVKKVSLEPQGKEISFLNINGGCLIKLEEFRCHQMIALSW